MVAREIYAGLEQVFHDVLDDNTIVLQDRTTARDVAGWDSLAHIRLIIAIEKKFKLRFGTAEVISLRNVGEMVKLIEKKLSGASGVGAG